MHTTNNVPQSRCRVFLIYGELSEMGRWSKRRWRHAEGLHFSLFSPHKQEKPVSVCHSAHKHTPTQRSKTQAHAQMQTCTTPTICTHTSHCSHHFHHSQTHKHTYTTPLLFSNTIPLSLTTPIQRHIYMPPPLTLTHAHTTKNHLTISPSQIHTGKSWGFTRTCLRTFSNELPLRFAASRQASFWWAICRYEYACESVIQAASTTYI